MTVSHNDHYPHTRIALALCALLAGIYLLSTGGHTSSKDEELLFGVTENLVVWKSFALNAARPDAPSEYSYYGPGQPVIAAPLYAIGRGVASFFPDDAYPWVTRVVTLWLNPLVTAATAAMLYLSVTLLGYSYRIALVTALIYGLATQAWPYSKTFFGEPLTALLPFAAFVLLQQAAQLPLALPRTKYVLFFASGVLTTLSLPVKVHAALVVPFVGIYALFVALMPFLDNYIISRKGAKTQRLDKDQTVGDTCLPETGAGYTPSSWFTLLLAWALGAGIIVLLLGWYQWSLYGNPFSTGYGSSVFSHFNPKYFWYRLSGLVWSPGRGVIWYSPPTLLLPLALWLLWKRSKPVALLCSAVILAHFGFYAMLLYWHGGGSWGPRYLTIAMPWMIVPLAAMLHTLRGWRTPWRTGLLVATLVIALPVQLGGITIANEAFFSTKRNVHRDHFDPLDSAIAGHLSLVVTQLTDYYTIYLAPNSVVFLSGFAYSEGNREHNEQVPRWSNHSPATIDVRPPQAQTVLLRLALNACRPAPFVPQPVTVRLQRTTLVDDMPCPPRTYAVLLPTQHTTLHIETLLWKPSEAGLNRDGVLGVQVLSLEAYADGTPLTLRGDLIPTTTMPTGYVSIRRWTGDHRLGHWDFWWYYILYSDLPAVPLGVLVGIWLTIAIGLIGWGAWNLRTATR